LSFSTQLPGTKMIQCKLAKKNCLLEASQLGADKPLPNMFVRMYSLEGNPLGLELAFTEPQNYILKPQKEGRGNNINKHDSPLFLKIIPRENGLDTY
jgi:hypothetical protein